MNWCATASTPTLDTSSAMQQDPMIASQPNGTRTFEINVWEVDDLSSRGHVAVIATKI